MAFVAAETLQPEAAIVAFDRTRMAGGKNKWWWKVKYRDSKEPTAF